MAGNARELSDCHVWRDEVIEVNGKCPACGSPLSWHPTAAPPAPAGLPVAHTEKGERR